jgi:cytidyltransferase-like protein
MTTIDITTRQTVLLTGGFDPLHEGHLDAIDAGAKLGRLIIGLNSDAWLEKKRGRYLPYATREAVLRHVVGVDSVVPVEDDADGTAALCIHAVEPDVFINGGDRADASDLPEAELEAMRLVGCEPVFLDQPKRNSSSRLMRLAVDATIARDYGKIPLQLRREPNLRSWGFYIVLGEGPGWKAKLLAIKPNASTSKQRHKHRVERMYCVRGSGFVMQEGFDGKRQHLFSTRPEQEAVFIPQHGWHQLFAGDQGMNIVEIQLGSNCDEEDIERQ